MTAQLITSLEQAGEGSRLLLVDLNAAPFTRTFFDALNGYATGGSGRCLETLAIWNARLAASTPVGGWQDVIGTGFFLLERLADFENRITTDEDGREFDGHIAPAIARFRSAVAKFAPPPPSVSTDNGPRPQEAVPTCDAKPAVVAHSTYLSAVAGRMAFRDAYRRCLPVVQAAEALAAKWTREGQKVDSDDFYAAINDVWEAVAKRNGDPLAKDDGAYAATPQPADGCSSNEGADA